MKSKLLLLLMISIIIITSCSKKEEPPKSWAMPSISSSNNYLFVGDEMFNKAYIVRIAEPIDRAIYSGRSLNGYGLDIILNYNTSSGFLGGSPTATRLRLFFGTYEECLSVKEQITKLLD